MDTLSARKVKLHGMKDSRWQVQDKISQYKGLINLYQRDKNISKFDNAVLRRKEKRMLTDFKKTIVHKRAELDNAIFGDREKIRCTLAEDKRLQCAYQHLPVDRIIEHIHQDNFNQRKLLDLLHYRKLQKGNYLIKLKLQVAELEDRITYHIIDVHSEKVNVATKIMTGKNQDAILKKEAAIVINETYKKIIKVMNKDRIYFDSILRCLHADVLKQNRCMLNAVILGQAAMEYLDDRKHELSKLGRAVKIDLTERLHTIRKTKQKAEKTFRSVKYFVRRDSDISMLPRSTYLQNGDIQNEIEDLDEILKELKNVFSATNYEDMFSRVTEQARENQCLKELREKFVGDRDILKNKVAHAEAVHQKMVNTMSESVTEYKKEKEQLQKQIQEQIDKAAKYLEKKSGVAQRIMEVKMCLQHIQQICNIIEVPKPKTRITKETSKASKSAEVFSVYENPKTIIELLLQKLPILVAYDATQKSKQTDLAWDLFEELSYRTHYKKRLDDDTEVDTWLDDLPIEEASVPNRQDIKAISKEIVLANKSSDEDFIWRPKRKY